MNEGRKIGAPIHFVADKTPSEYKVNIPGLNQQENAHLAVSTLKFINNFYIPQSSLKKGLNTVQWFGRNQQIREDPHIVFDVAHNVESIQSFLEYYSSLGITGKSILIIALQARKHIKPLVSTFQKVFNHIICTEAPGHNPMDGHVLRAFFNKINQTEIISNPEEAIQHGIENISFGDGMAIIGSHYLGPAVSKVFKISFDKY